MIVTSTDFTLKELPAFIVLDGVNGAGKSTLQARIKELFESHRKPVHLTREPGATEIGGHIRNLLLGNKTEPPCAACELLLFGADRAEHVAKVIEPKLAAGCSVVSDRYYYSTVAFQGYGRRMNMSLIDRINAIAIQGRLPALFILLDLDPREGLKRKKDSPAEHDRFEHEEFAFQERMRNGFLEIGRAVAEPCLVVDAMMGPDQVFESVRRAIEPILAA